MIYDVYEYTNEGGRSYNEDSVTHDIYGNSGLFAVADGLGGHQYGEVASECVCYMLLEEWQRAGGETSAQWLEDTIELANQKVLELQKEKKADLKSTVVALAINNGRAVWANVGDSRLYYIHNSRIEAVTNDHSVAFKRYKAGEISRDDIRTDADQSGLLRAVGNVERHKPEVYDYDVIVQPGDAFMLCTDGMWEYLSDEEVLFELLKSRDAKEWSERLLLRLMNRIKGNNDNLTILTVMAFSD